MLTDFIDGPIPITAFTSELEQYKRLGTFEVLHPQDARDIGNILAHFGYFRYGDMLHKYADEMERLNQ